MILIFIIIKFYYTFYQTKYFRFIKEKLPKTIPFNLSVLDQFIEEYFYDKQDNNKNSKITQKPMKMKIISILLKAKHGKNNTN
jgi:hypothetical protein